MLLFPNLVSSVELLSKTLWTAGFPLTGSAGISLVSNT